LSCTGILNHLLREEYLLIAIVLHNRSLWLIILYPLEQKN
jgi:hypothetical protein